MTERWGMSDAEEALVEAIAARDAAVRRLEKLQATIRYHLDYRWGDRCADDTKLVEILDGTKWERRPLPGVDGHTLETDTAENVE